MTATSTKAGGPEGFPVRGHGKEALPGRLPTVLRHASRLARRAPFTVLVLVLLWSLAAATGSFVAGPHLGQLDAVSGRLDHLVQGRWWTLFSSLFFGTNPGAYFLSTVLIIALVGLLEIRAGTVRTMLVFFGGQLAAVTVFALVTQLARYGGDGWLGPMVDAVQLGPYPAVAACGTVAASFAGALWRRRLRIGIFAVATMLVLYIGHAETILTLIGALAGLLFGWWARGSSTDVMLHRSTARETRTILAVVVVVFAVGPLLTAFAHSPSGPLAILREIVLNPVPTINELQSRCGGSVDAVCLQLAQNDGGLGATLTLGLAVVPALLLLVCAEGLRRGRILAVWITIGVQLAVVGISVTYLTLFARIPNHPLRPHTAVLGSGFAHLLPVAVTPLVIALALFLYRRRFTVATEHAAARRLGLLVAATWLLLAGAYTVVWLWHGGPVRRSGGVGALLAELARQYLPLPVPGTMAAAVAGRSGVEVLLFNFCGPVFWLVVLLGVLWVFLVRDKGRLQVEGGAERARALVRRGGDSLSWMALWVNNHYWFAPGGQAAVAYQVHGNVAVTVAGPIGDPGERAAAAEGFLSFCAHRALTPCFYSVTDELWPLLRARGFSRVSVAQETRLRIRELAFTGKEWQNVRTALNKARKLGITAQWYRYREMPAHLRLQLNEVSEEWAARKQVPEMGFTLGGLDELMDPNVLCCLALDGEGRVHGVTSWLPVYRDGRVVSWTLDFMRRRMDGFAGAMEFLIASAVQDFRSSVDVISLSGSPLAPDPNEDAPDLQLQDAALAGLLNMVGKALEPVYGFRSLAHFKSRFQPEYRTLYMMYPDPLTLPSIGRALSQAYLPGLSVRQTARLLRGKVA
jgi:lysylphosphatidylglycerol synthetase-like protein (DUF2156 family)